MVWGFIRLALFATAFLMGLLLSDSIRHSVEPAHDWARIQRNTNETTCRANKFVLTDVPHRWYDTAGHAGGM